MSIDGEKKTFVIKHIFTNVLALKGGKSSESEVQTFYNVEWLVSIQKTTPGSFTIAFDCPIIAGNNDYYIEVDVTMKLLKNNSEKEESFPKKFEFFSEPHCKCGTWRAAKSVLVNYLIDGNLTVEFHVEIFEMTGIKKDLRNFDDNKLSDVVLIVKGRKFHVLKQLLAVHSSYFNSLFFGNFEESKQSEVELKDIDPKDFQNYLELIYGESVVHDCTVSGMLKLADFFDSKTAIRRCEDFLLKSSQKTLKQKFELANNYKLEKLMEKCLSEIKTFDDIRSIVPKNNYQFEQKLANELLQKAVTLGK